ncbi:30S ribosomal protein S16 [Auxenochlorella protothecoides]|uniref:30S ribosomal protein S16, chloroplastic n=1 Tax=Auxenochlorella protothecoides TaxID=3075 RepID=A0A087S9Q2_AUXPR|nr:30S ribosomal protein S16 [Auxenochlorella protothecoides]KFM22456.1 30S ribosomal protein S16 [Auxenochlorella protothecoides]RMZ55104.1 hypothetical protein APUTEX25_005382 [Auxenochlorella protothecoides]|eukprot:RMZ55104.1 hypothetical protein APUTEX25_005382 [Auxenochlorella protothecoides]
MAGLVQQVPSVRMRSLSFRSNVSQSQVQMQSFLGWYNPLSKETSLNAPSIKKWLEVGAQPSDTVAALLKKAMVLDS